MGAAPHRDLLNQYRGDLPENGGMHSFQTRLDGQTVAVEYDAEDGAAFAVCINAGGLRIFVIRFDTETRELLDKKASEHHRLKLADDGEPANVVTLRSGLEVAADVHGLPMRRAA